MRTLEEHPNTVKLVDVYDQSDTYVLVMELCTGESLLHPSFTSYVGLASCVGGELFDQIISKGHFSEKDAAEKMRSLLDFIAFAHSKNIIHRQVILSGFWHQVSCPEGLSPSSPQRSQAREHPVV